MSDEIKLQMAGISKTFPGVKALDDINITLRKGTVHAIMGENGAGKSTLMKILNGIYTADCGEIFVDGQKVAINGPGDAAKYGISMIYQELNFFGDLTIEENMFMGRFPSRIPGIVNWKEVKERAAKILEENDIGYDPSTKLKDLSVSQIQMLEIVKAVAFKSDIIIMDEPTSSIGSKEVDVLFNTIARLKAQGVSFLYISHKMAEIFRIADDITVIRDGKWIVSGKASEFTDSSLVYHMVGREITNYYPKEEVPVGDVVFELKDLSSKDMFEDINMQVRKCEIVGMAGLVGAGRTELMRAVFGLDPFDGGEIFIEGKKVQLGSVKSAIRNGILMVSEDRRKEGIIGIRSIRENISLAKLHAEKGRFINLKKELAETEEIAKKLRVKAASIEDPIDTLSGGNQQKVMLCKWLLLNSKILILDEPTRGIDIGAKQEIYNIITHLVKDLGISVILVSSEMPELIGMCDRIYVMNKGHLTGNFERGSFNQEDILRLAI
ncbi:sugar ABC transporter ATP-binding protein [Caproicibacter sp. BJN0012]|uniref:sugar ABC transporter ATP-binding protein n=1 Tax=Caproicibacter sp. BJN0012 TaxID=3110227 RepID=UPI002E0E9B9C